MYKYNNSHQDHGSKVIVADRSSRLRPRRFGRPSQTLRYQLCVECWGWHSWNMEVLVGKSTRNGGIMGFNGKFH